MVSVLTSLLSFPAGVFTSQDSSPSFTWERNGKKSERRVSPNPLVAATSKRETRYTVAATFLNGNPTGQSLTPNHWIHGSSSYRFGGSVMTFLWTHRSSLTRNPRSGDQSKEVFSLCPQLGSGFPVFSLSPLPSEHAVNPLTSSAILLSLLRRSSVISGCWCNPDFLFSFIVMPGGVFPLFQSDLRARVSQRM